MEENSVGTILRLEREKKGLSISEAARQMRLSHRQVEALESDNFQELPGNTFVRGFIRNYAKLLQLDAESLLAMLDPIIGAQNKSETGTGPKTEAIPFTRAPKASGLRYAIWVLILLFPILAFEIYRENQAPAPKPKVLDLQNAQLLAQQVASQAVAAPPTAASVPAAPESAPAALAASAPAPQLAESAPAPVPAPRPAAAVPVAAPVPAVEPRPNVEAAPKVAGGAKIALSFEEKSWVEIKDASGKVIYSKLNAPGDTPTVVGKPPFALVVGNAAHVKLDYNGKPVDLIPYINVTVARLTLE